jgi:hypothetical protein
MIRRPLISAICAANFLLGAGLGVVKSVWLPDLSGFHAKMDQIAFDLAKEPFSGSDAAMLFWPSTAHSPYTAKEYQQRRELVLSMMNATWTAHAEQLITAAKNERIMAKRMNWFVNVALAAVSFNATASLVLLVLLKGIETPAKDVSPTASV